MSSDDSINDIPVLTQAEPLTFTPVVPEDTSRLTFSTACYTRGLTGSMVIEGYRQGAFPWPDESAANAGLYPWGRLFPCTVLQTGRLKLTHSMKRRVRDAVRGHYEGVSLEILLDESFDETIEEIARYHRSSDEGTWMSDDLVSTWKELHFKGHAHAVTVHIGGELAGGLYFTSIGRMLYGESMFTYRSDASKLALTALAALAGMTRLPVIDCQMPTDHVMRFGAVILEGSPFLRLNASLAAMHPYAWHRAQGISLLPFLERTYPEYVEDAPTDSYVKEHRIAHAGGMLFETVAVVSKCSYYVKDGRDSVMEIIPLPSKDPRIPNMYNRLIAEGFRRDSSYLYRLACEKCRRCIPTRIDVTTFKPDATMRKTFRKNAGLVMRELSLSAVTDEQYALYKRYQNGRHKNGPMSHMSRETVNQVLFSSCTDSRILEFRASDASQSDNALKMVCIIDRLDNAISAVYTFFEPDEPKLSLGTFGILSEIEYARENGLRYVYLGYWLPGHPGMDYKKRFQPLELYWNQEWVPEKAFNADPKLLDQIPS